MYTTEVRLLQIPFEHRVAWQNDLEAWLDKTYTQCDSGQCILLKDSKDWHDSWKWIVTEISWIPNWLTWLCRQLPCSKVTRNNCHYLQNDSLPHFPHHDWWVPLFSFTSSKRVTNTRYSLSEDKSSLICFTNLREEFIPKTSLSMFNWMSPLKQDLVSFMFREYEQLRKKTPKGLFFVNSLSEPKNR